MSDTSQSLLQRIKCGEEPDAWNQLYSIYEPLLRYWLIAQRVSESDADDLVQEVLATLTQELKKFEHNGRPGAFRKWLKTILINRLRNFWRSRDNRPTAKGGDAFELMIKEMEDSDSELSRIWDEEHDKFLLAKLWQIVKARFSETTCKAFQRYVRDGVSASDVATELGISNNAVLIAKSRVLKELRQVGEGMLD